MIFFTTDGEKTSELLRNLLSQQASAGESTLGSHSSIQVSMNHIENKLHESSLCPKCAFALLSPDVFRSHVAVMRFHNIFSKLQSASRFFPIVVDDHENVLSSLTKTLPLIADRRPFLLTEKNAEDFVDFVKAKLDTSSNIDIESTFDVETISAVWPEHETVVSVSLRRGKLGVVIENIKVSVILCRMLIHRLISCELRILPEKLSQCASESLSPMNFTKEINCSALLVALR